MTTPTGSATPTTTDTEPGSRPPRRPARRRRLLTVGLVVLALVAGYTAWTNLRPLTLTATIEIDASQDEVWAVLADLSSYHEWNPFIVSSRGDLEPGATLHNTMRDATGEMAFTPTVLTVTPGRELRWLGSVGPGGIFDGEHRFLIEPVTADRVRLVQSEEFRGVLIPFFRGRLLEHTLPQFHAMNRALAERVAQRASRCGHLAAGACLDIRWASRCSTSAGRACSGSASQARVRPSNTATSSRVSASLPPGSCAPVSLSHRSACVRAVAR